MHPLQTASTRLKSLRERGIDDILVGYSGGKDSLVCLDLCHRLGFNVKAFFYRYCYLECEERWMNFARNRYGIEIVYLPHPGLSALLRTSTLRHVDPAREQAVAKISPNDLERIARKRTGYDWICYGHRRSDSLQRAGMINQCDGIWENKKDGTPIHRIYPISEFKPKDVADYLRSRKIPIPEMYGALARGTSGVSPENPDCVLWLKKNYPADYQRLKVLFPLIDNLIAREEVRAKHEIKARTNTKIRWAKDAKREAGE